MNCCLAHELDLFCSECEKQSSSHCPTLLFFVMVLQTTKNLEKKNRETDGNTPSIAKGFSLISVPFVSLNG
jgi:hypothetical protein